MNDEKNILIVDDELGPREALRMILKDRYQLDFATNGQEAVNYVQSNSVDLIIMDIKMPIMDGMEALKLIKDYNPFIGTIMVTGYGTINTAVEAIKVGAFDYISKPFDSFEILEKVEKALDDIKEKIEKHKMLVRLQEASDNLSKQQEHMQEQLIQLSKLSSVGMLAQGLAHNLSSPLLIILGRAELMKDKLVDLRSRLSDLGDADSAQDIDEFSLFREFDQNIRDTEVIIENVNKLSETIKNMMNKCRQDHSREKKFINLSQMLEEELKFLEADLYFKHTIEKDIKLEPELPLIEGIYSDFSQALLNLIKNSIEAMHESPMKELTIKTFYDEKFIYAVVHDTGCGIAEENMDKIFQPYFSTKKSRDDGKEVSGTGLGLHMVEILMKPYKAQIEVQSKPGDTSFILKIPYAKDIEL